MENEALNRINGFLAKHDMSVDTISKQRVSQFEKADTAIQARLAEIQKTKDLLKGCAINVTTISADSGIARKTFYNNDLLRLFVEEYATTEDEKTASAGELERLKAKYEELERRIRMFLLRDIETENLRQENLRLQAEIQSLESRNSSLETQYGRMQAELEQLKARVPLKQNVVDFPNKN